MIKRKRLIAYVILITLISAIGIIFAYNPGVNPHVFYGYSEIVGVYSLEDGSFTLELEVNLRRVDVNLDEFYQSDPHAPNGKIIGHHPVYLDITGTKPLSNLENETWPTRLLLHFDRLNFEEPFYTPLGYAELPSPKPLPERLVLLIRN